MTDRYRTLSVLLSQDTRDDDLVPLIEAISMLKGVAKVMPGNVLQVSDYMAVEMAKLELHGKILELLS